jgi:hypothetical protein
VKRKREGKEERKSIEGGTEREMCSVRV